MKKLFWLITLVFYISLNASPSDTTGKNLEIKLVTIGPSSELNSWWGHTALIVDNKTTKRSRFYNYGIFSYEEENFYTDFAQGRLIFRVDAWNTFSSLLYYKNQNRDIVIQTLNLSDYKKLEIDEFLRENIKPENCKYLYDHYYDNCSTRVRDILNNAVNDQFRETTQNINNLNLRQHTRRHTQHHFWMDWLLMFLMNDSIDKPITDWDTMFLPTGLEKYADSLVYVDQSGNNIQLVKEKVQYYKAVDFRDVPEKASSAIPVTLLYSMICVALILANIFFIGSYKIHAIFVSTTGILFGLIGTILFYIAIFSDHIVTHGNENLLLANPLTLLMLPAGICFFIRPEKAKKYLNILLLVLCLLAVLSPILNFIPVFDQDNWAAICLILPVLISLHIFNIRMRKPSGE